MFLRILQILSLAFVAIPSTALHAEQDVCRDLASGNKSYTMQVRMTVNNKNANGPAMQMKTSRGDLGVATISTLFNGNVVSEDVYTYGRWTSKKAYGPNGQVTRISASYPRTIGSDIRASGKDFAIEYKIDVRLEEPGKDPVTVAMIAEEKAKFQGTSTAIISGCPWSVSKYVSEVKKQVGDKTVRERITAQYSPELRNNLTMIHEQLDADGTVKSRIDYVATGLTIDR